MLLLGRPPRFVARATLVLTADIQRHAQFAIWMQAGAGRLLWRPFTGATMAARRASASGRSSEILIQSTGPGVRSQSPDFERFTRMRRGGRVVEGPRLESGRTRKGTASSNLALSASDSRRYLIPVA